jgi:hypothetical protein
VRLATVLLLLVVLLVGSGALAAGPSSAHLALVRAQPLTVRGTGFHARERVRLVLGRASAGTAARARATAAGAFTAVVPGRLQRCAGVTVTAIGDHGSRATLRRGAHEPACSQR